MAATITRKLVSLADAADALAVSTRTVRRIHSETLKRELLQFVGTK